MGFNVTGTEVASGVLDPSMMFVTVSVILLIGLIGYAAYNIFLK
jgi:hypothetical protein